MLKEKIPSTESQRKTMKRPGEINLYHSGKLDQYLVKVINDNNTIKILCDEIKEVKRDKNRKEARITLSIFTNVEESEG